MKKSDINPMPPYFDRYINLVEPGEVEQAFVQSDRQLDELDKSLLTNLGDKKYAPDKWTVKEIIQHLIDWERILSYRDWERILSYRALLIARNEGSPLQSVDENLLAAKMNAGRRTIDTLVDELKAVRRSTKAMFGSFDDEMLLNTGINWKYEMSALAMGFTVIGHQIHHLKIIEEKYLPLLKTD